MTDTRPPYTVPTKDPGAPPQPTDNVAEGALWRRRVLFWGGLALAVLLMLWVFRSVLMPFVVGMLLAYFLDPVADMLERRGLSRTLAAIVILVVAIAVLMLGFVLIVPVLANQLSGFVERLPTLLSNLQTLVTSYGPAWLERVFGVDKATLEEGLNQALSQGSGFLASFIESVWNSGAALMDIAGLFIIAPVVAFYMLIDWDRMVASVDAHVPRRHVETVRAIARDVDRAVAGFIRGQGSVCLILGIYYAIGLTLVGLNFGLLIGLGAGIISFIPYIGSTIGLVVALGVALVQFWPDFIWIAATLAVFFSGQFIEGNILQPKLVGGKVGLHPVWLMFALFAFGALFGFIGLLVAVPAAAAVGVIVRFLLARYRQSHLYDATRETS
ncbi:AI-2E family transporter [Notoacmeibacter sp. MSK16QG-6]|uniref:AI-2E family transporter n=1 Tax=Notoacmeibacter sp. MSK16QG-6 TaxID=2957982 RepID=UPI00209DFE2C|nr:AI-2E family transporter [Notoacmeibacter sp. MSK16QG-6]MCP1197951.1 AI-2E family transporter [Notoacmeibacter sp. MSK16QG-6]